MKWIKHLRKMFVKLNLILAGWDNAVARIAALENELKKRTTVGCDIGFRQHENYVVMIGTLNGRDYVQTFSIPGDSFTSIAQSLKASTKYANVKFVDAPPTVCAVMLRELCQ